VTGLAERGIGFRSLQEAIDTTSGGKLVVHVFVALAEFARDLIRERTGTRVWSLMQLERQLRPPAYRRRRGGHLDHRRTRTVDG
jgi:DNA invertase Pin-like site-specific DNA recombinase